MKLNNKIELKKVLACNLCIIIIINMIFIIFNYYQYKIYTSNFNKKINMIVTKLNREYPNIDKNDLIELLSNNEMQNDNLLKEYGINLNEDSVVLENDRYFSIFIKLNIGIMLSLSILIILVFLRYDYLKSKKLKEITRYIEEINNKNYKLDIDDNTEDELSILKNELYKITVMLKEVAENSMKDKLNLKDSLSNISHQLKTPLTSITIMLDNILDNPNMDAETRNEFINDIKREVININFLVNSLLKLSKLDADSVSFTSKAEYIKNILNESIKNVEVLCDLKNITIDIIGDETIKAQCDFKWQVEAITNILKNGIEHSNTNSKIVIGYEQNTMYSKIEIKDFGIGIDSNDLSHVFERFYRGRNSSNDSVGIGLALAKSIIERDNGYITVESKPNEGTTFIIKYFIQYNKKSNEKNNFI